MVKDMKYPRTLLGARILFVCALITLLYGLFKWELVPTITGGFILVASGIIYFTARHFYKLHGN
jgi:hypothetical protein